MTWATATRRALIAAALALAAAGGALGAVTAPQPDDMALGSPKARVTVIEYGSVGCPHCAKWANEVFPAFKTKYVDTGRARFVFRELLTGDPTLATAGFMLARCAGPKNYFPVVEAIFTRQASMYAPGGSRGAVLSDIAKSVGLSDDAFQACLHDQTALDALNARSDRHGKDGVDSTPTFFVNGTKLDGELTLAQLDAAIAKARHRR